MIKVLLIFLIACFGYSDYFTGKSLQTRPLVLGPLVGLAMGDLQTGCVIGATMELALMGAVGVGAALPPEVVSGGILGTAFAIAGHKDAGMAVALGLPIAMLVMLLRNFLFIAIVPLLQIEQISMLRKVISKEYQECIGMVESLECTFQWRFL